MVRVFSCLALALLPAGIAFQGVVPKQPEPEGIIMAGRNFEYVVANADQGWSYTIEVSMNSEEELKWEYTDAPTPEEIGTNQIQNPENADLYRYDLGTDAVLMGWYEAPTGTQVVDVFDLKYGRLYNNMFKIDKEMDSFGGFSHGVNPIKELTEGAAPFAAVDFNPTKMSGRTFEYSVAGYTIEIKFIDEMTVKWEYLNAPSPEEIGTSMTQTVDSSGLYRYDVSEDIILFGWSEAGENGGQIFDVFDLNAMKLYANFAYIHEPNPSGDFFKNVADIVETTP